MGVSEVCKGLEIFHVAYQLMSYNADCCYSNGHGLCRGAIVYVSYYTRAIMIISPIHYVAGPLIIIM